MQFKTSALASLSLLSVASARPSDLRARQSGPCATGIHMIATPGAGNADPPYGLLSTLISNVTAAIPGSSDIAVPYNHTQTNGTVQTAEGASNLNTYLQEYHTSCPDSKIALIGYSAGAIATLNVICGEQASYPEPRLQPLDATTFSNVVAIVAYGDETRAPDQSYDLGTCTGGGEHPRLNPSTCDPFASKIQSYCDSEDPLCCATTGTDMEQHYVYANEYNANATSFIVDQFNA